MDWSFWIAALSFALGFIVAWLIYRSKSIELEQTQKTLQTTESNLNQTRAELANEQANHRADQGLLAAANANLSDLQAQLDERETRLNQLATESGALAALQLRYQTESTLRAQAEESEAKLSAEIAKLHAKLSEAGGMLTVLQMRYQTETTLRTQAEESETKLRAELRAQQTAAVSDDSAVHFAVPMGDETSATTDVEAQLNQLRDQHLAESQATLKLATDAQAEAERLRLRVKELESQAAGGDDGAVHFGVPMGDEETTSTTADPELQRYQNEIAYDRPAVNFAVQLDAEAEALRAKVTALEAKASDGEGAVHFGVPMDEDSSKEAELQARVKQLELELSETAPYTESEDTGAVNFSIDMGGDEDDGSPARSAMADAAQWESRFAELQLSADSGSVNFAAPMGDSADVEAQLNQLRDQHLAESQATLKLATDAQAEAERLRLRVKELEAQTAGGDDGAVHFGVPMGDEETISTTADPELQRYQNEIAYDRPAVNFAVQLDAEAEALRAKVAALEAKAADGDGAVHFGVPMGDEGGSHEAELQARVKQLELELSETAPYTESEDSGAVNFSIDMGGDEDNDSPARSAMADAAQWESRFAELQASADSGSVHFGVPMGADEDDSASQENAQLKAKVQALELQLSETAPYVASAPAEDTEGAVHFGVPMEEEAPTAVSDSELEQYQANLAVDRSVSFGVPMEEETPATETVSFAAPMMEEESATEPATATTDSDDLSFLTPGACTTTDPLEDINGIGPKFAERLRKAGVCTFAQLARLSPAQIRRLAKVKDWQKVEPEHWIAEAKQLMAGRG